MQKRESESRIRKKKGITRAGRYSLAWTNRRLKEKKKNAHIGNKRKIFAWIFYFSAQIERSWRSTAPDAWISARLRKKCAQIFVCAVASARLSNSCVSLLKGQKGTVPGRALRALDAPYTPCMYEFDKKKERDSYKDKRQKKKKGQWCCHKKVHFDGQIGPQTWHTSLPYEKHSIKKIYVFQRLFLF